MTEQIHSHHQLQHQKQNRKRLRTVTSPSSSRCEYDTTNRSHIGKRSRSRALLQQPRSLLVVVASAWTFCCCCLLQQSSWPAHAFQVSTITTTQRRLAQGRSVSETQSSLIRMNMVAQITSTQQQQQQQPSSSPSVPPQNSSSYQQSNGGNQYDSKQLMKSRLPEIQLTKENMNMNNPHARRHEKKSEEQQSMTRLEIEFRDLLEGILYTDEEVDTVVNPRLRTVLEGIAASYHDPAVYRAFEVLYCDAGPLRVAGRIMYSKLRTAIERSTAKQQEQFATIVDTTSLTKDEVTSCWSTYLKWIQFYEYEDHQPQNTDTHHHHEDGTISVWAVQKLIEKGSTSTILKNLKCMSTEEAMEKINPHGRDSLPFDQLVRNVFDATSLSTTRSGSTNMLQQVFDIDMDDEREMSSLLSSSSSSSWPTKSKCKYNRRYDEMLEQFDEWKEFIMPSSSCDDGHDPDIMSSKERKQQRRMDIMKGCFVGSENPKVVEALRVIYVDNAALRLSGDWIFKTVSVLINRQQQKRKRQQQRP